MSKKVNERAYTVLIRRSSAKIVMGIGLTEDLCRSSNSLGIETIEVQHAMGYSQPYLSWERRLVEELPTKTICYDSATKLTYSKFGKVEPILLDHPYLSKSAEKNIEIGRGHKKSQLHYSEINPEKTRVLYCMQWGYGGEISHLNGILENGMFPNILSEMIDRTVETIDWHFRLHPVQMYDTNYEHIRSYLQNWANKKANVFFCYASQNSFKNVANAMDGVLTMSSLSVYDAALLGVRSGFLCPSVKFSSRNRFTGEDLVQHGYLQKIDWQLDQLREWIDWIKTENELLPYQSEIETIEDYLVNSYGFLKT